MALNPGFDLVQAAEGLLSDARRLMTTAKWGRSEEDELEVRRRITQTAKQIAFETSPPMDALKSDWVVVSFSSPYPRNRKLTITSSPTSQHVTCSWTGKHSI